MHFDWVLAPYDLAGSRAHARVLHRRRPARRRRARAHARRARRARGRRALRCVHADAGRRGRPHRARARAGREARHARRQAACRPVAQRPGGDRLPALPARPRDAARRPRSSTCRRRCSTRPSAHVDTAAPGFTHLQHAQPVSFGHELAKHVHAFARDVDRLQGLDARGRTTRRSVPVRSPVRRCRSTRRRPRPSSASPTRSRTRSTP